MLYNAIPATDFLNREQELNYLKSLSVLKEKALGGDVFLEGARGIGKTELLRQLYRTLFWEDTATPFYYSFKTANLKSTYFARDYFTGFVRQYLAWIKKDPTMADNAAQPLPRFIPAIATLGLVWLLECIENFQEYVRIHDYYGQMMTAIAAPALAAQKSGLPVYVMLDDFDAASQLYETSRGDMHGLISLFAESMQNRRCPHVMTGAAGALDAVFSDHALLGMTERMPLGPLPQDLAVTLFRTHLENLKIGSHPEADFEFLNLLQGNPLYIRNIAKAAGKMQKQELQGKDLIDCYSLDVAAGETAFYWSSVFSRSIRKAADRRAMIELLMLAVDNGSSGDSAHLLMASGLGGAEAGGMLERLETSGMLKSEDAVCQDVIRCLYAREIEGGDANAAMEKIAARYSSDKEGMCFELVIPMSADAELVVAKAVEQIGKNMNLDTELLNYLQLALIEVCINAIEHSGSYEKKVFLKFITRPTKLEIIVENSGKYFSADSLREVPVEEKLRKGMKRGWGFKLVYSIMDSVKIERINDRTRITLTKDITDKEVPT